MRISKWSKEGTFEDVEDIIQDLEWEIEHGTFTPKNDISKYKIKITFECTESGWEDENAS